MAHLTSHHTYPPFPEDITTAPLVSISLNKLEAGDAAESAAFFKCCKDLGFFYLDMAGSQLGETVVREAEQLNRVQTEFFKLPNEAKDPYKEGVIHPYFAYKYSELDTKDENGAPMRNQVYNLRKDDILGLTNPRLPTHPMILENQKLLENYATHCHTVVELLLEHLNAHLELPKGTLLNIHRVTERAGDHVRFTCATPQAWNEERIQMLEHTDYGSLTVLFNWMGGLQIRKPDTKDWVYVRPVPGSCIVNLGDAMVTFTAGILRSNIHRVVPAPAPQDTLDRNSLVFFVRPEDDVILKRLEGGIIDAQPRSTVPELGMTSHEWVMKRGTGILPGIYTKEGLETEVQDTAFTAPSGIRA